MDPRMYPVGNQSIPLEKVVTAPAGTELIELSDATNTNTKTYAAITDVIGAAGGVATDATAAELNAVAGMPTQATFVIGAENTGAGTKAVGIQLKDADGADVAVQCAVLAFLSDDANGNTGLVASAPSGGWVAGTDGYLCPIVAGKMALLISEADGDIDLTITEAGAKTVYLRLVLPNGKVIGTAEIEWAA